MGPFLLLAAGVTVWAWWTGRLKNFSYEDGVAVGIFLLGMRLMTTGKIFTGAAMMAGAIFWAAYRRRKATAPAMPIDDARRLLGVGPDASLADIRSAHRRLIARVHPDAGGSAELAHRVNAARDVLIAEMNRKTPRAS